MHHCDQNPTEKTDDIHMDLQDTFGGIEAVQLPVPSDWKGDTVELATANLSTTNLSEIDSPQNEEKKPQDDEKKTFYQTLLLFLGLVVATFLDSLDGTLLATNLSAIATELKNVEDMAWVPSIYLLTFTAFQPIYGKFSDIFGRKACLLFAIILFVIASIGCGLSPTMKILIVMRAFQGIGGAGLLATTLIVITDIYPIDDRPKYMAIIMSVYGLSSVVGPVIGGSIAANLGWRWSFYINGPLGFITILSVLFLLRLPRPKTTFKDQIARVDFLGTALLIATIFALLLPLTYGGTKWAWNSAEVIGLLFAFVILLALFILVEVKFAKEPTIPAHIFKVRTVTAVVVAELFQGMAYIGLIWFTPVFFQVVRNNSTTMSGLQLTPLMVGIVTFAGLTGATAKFIRSYRPYMWIGSATLTVGVAMMSTLSEESNRAMEIAYVFLVGSGVGMTIQMMLLAAQGAVVGEDVAIVTALTQFFQNIGGAIGICIYSTVLQNALPKNVMSVVPPELLTPNVTLAVSQSITSIQSHLPPAVIPYVVHAYVLSLQSSFRVGIPIAGASFLALLFVKGQRLGGSGKPVEKEAAEV